MKRHCDGPSIVIDVFCAPDCGRCQKAKKQLAQMLANMTDYSIAFHELSVVEYLDYAVELGVLSTPSVAINGELVFSSMPSEKQLRQALSKRTYASKKTLANSKQRNGGSRYEQNRRGGNPA